MTLYGKNIIQRKNTDRQTSAIFFDLFWNLFLFRQQIPYFCWYYLYWAAHNGSNYLNGHCFVRVMFCVPVWNGDKVSHLSLHIYRETGAENSKSISDWSKQCFVFVACEEQDKEKLEEYITELHKNINRTEIKKSGYFVGNGRGNGKKYFYENRFPFRCI